MKCERIGCESEAVGYIDFAYTQNDTARIWFCKADYDNLFTHINEMIEGERKSGELGATENYAFVPPHMTKKVLNFKG